MSYFTAALIISTCISYFLSLLFAFITNHGGNGLFGFSAKGHVSLLLASAFVSFGVLIVFVTFNPTAFSVPAGLINQGGGMQ